MGVLTFCRATLRRGRASRKSRSSKDKDVNHNRNGNKTRVIAGRDGRVDPRVHEAKFEVRLVCGQEDAIVEYVNAVLCRRRDSIRELGANLAPASLSSTVLVMAPVARLRLPRNAGTV